MVDTNLKNVGNDLQTA